MHDSRTASGGSRVSLPVPLSPWIFCPPSLVQCHVYNRCPVEAWLKWENEQWAPHHSCRVLSLSPPVPRCSLAVPGPLRDLGSGSGNSVRSVKRATQKGTCPTDLEIYKMLLLREKMLKDFVSPFHLFLIHANQKALIMHLFMHSRDGTSISMWPPVLSISTLLVPKATAGGDQNPEHKTDFFPSFLPPFLKRQLGRLILRPGWSSGKTRQVVKWHVADAAHMLPHVYMDHMSEVWHGNGHGLCKVKGGCKSVCGNTTVPPFLSLGSLRTTSEGLPLSCVRNPSGEGQDVSLDSD